MTLDEARNHVGDSVTYCAGLPWAEDGVITGTGEEVVYVAYGGRVQSQATLPADLTLLPTSAATAPGTEAPRGA